MKKLISIALITVLLVTAVYANGSSEKNERGSLDDNYSLTFACTISSENATGKATQEFFDRISEVTDGHVTVKTSWSGTLGNEHDLGINIVDGSIDFAIVGPGEWANYDKSFYVFDTPFLFRDTDHYYSFIKSDDYKAFIQKVGDEIGMEILITENQGVKGVINKVRAVYAPSDLAGLKIRTPDSASLIAVQNAMGGIASPVAASEQYMSLSQGIIDGADHSLSAHVAWNLIELAKYYTETNHAIQSTYIVASKKTMDKLPEEYADAIRKLAAEYQDIINGIADAQLATDEEKALAAGVQIVRHSEVDEAAFKEAEKDIIAQFSSYNPELYSTITTKY